LFGGRIAEELIFGADNVTTGASNDIERATGIARNMVTKWGLSDVMGPLAYSEDDGEVFLGRSVTQHKNMADETAHAIDREIRGIVERNYAHARKIVEDNIATLHAMSEALIKYETLDSEQLQRIMRGEPPGDPEGWNDASGGRPATTVITPEKPKVPPATTPRPAGT
jgi:cell division protease FtsH